MNAAEALRSIEDDLLEYVQKRITVEFDNALQMPVEFCLDGKRHHVQEALGRFRTRAGRHLNGYLVKTREDEVFFLYFQWLDESRLNAPIQAGSWVLSFRILSDRELMAFYREGRKMLVNMALKRVADFHGHLCPELVLGAKLCDYILDLLSDRSQANISLAVIAENCSSAIDAIQVMLGATLGNQRLHVMDHGKHNYTVLPNDGKGGVKLSFRPPNFGDEDEYGALEEKIRRQQVTLEEVVHFQGLLDARAKRLLALDHQELFDVSPTDTAPPPSENATCYVTCNQCSQPVLNSRAVDFNGRFYCMPCFQRLHVSGSCFSLQ
jgi:formylmethanofuran dehydrogenase subunit E